MRVKNYCEIFFAKLVQPRIENLVALTLVAAFTPIGLLSDLTSFGTLFAFAMVCLAVWLLRRREPNRERPFRVPALPVIAPLGIVINLVLIGQLSALAQQLAISWMVVGLCVYFLYSRRHSQLHP